MLICYWLIIISNFAEQGYGGGDEARMLQRHLLGKSVKIRVGADRAVTATTFIAKYGCSDPRVKSYSKRVISDEKVGIYDHSDGIGAVLLDDGMQVCNCWFHFFYCIGIALGKLVFITTLFT